ncbi:SurA N-terminal domain-containing protein [Vogesella sp. LIG4]|uniref:SurA N-terminal domain-containing protein n=1 Tax=Vogesella sp. LIG4 TaxID=1192162 RepID=UPI00081F9DC9|nr:SurA N-terminal domain-containing protein [Vogesella sp. LIG4]SCK24130.1 peptidyl-prolyl cis-trans isomerase D [Vogesella sp. LIG4]
MFDFVHNNNAAIKIILGAVALTFVGFGIGSYSAAVDDPYLAKVGDAKIYKRDLERQLQDQPANAASRQAALENLIRQEMLLAEARSAHLAVAPEQLRTVIAGIPAFQDGGKFSPARYQEFLTSRNMSAETFEAQLSRDLLLQAQTAPYLRGQFVSHTLQNRLAAMMTETREVRALVLKPEQFAANVKLDDAMLKAYYDANLKRFKAEETVKLDYVLLSQAQLAQGVQVSDDEAKAYFDKSKGEFGGEQRDVSHILLAVNKGASAADKAKVKAEAEAILKEVRANPAKFAELAKAKSQDPGSAANGGDLGFFARGAMAKPFEDVAFRMQKGQISEVVETEFGYHILKLNDIKGSDFDSQKAAVVARLQQQKAAALFRSKAEKLGEVAYQQADSLKGLEALGLTVQHSDALPRTGKAGDPVLSNRKALDAAFGDDVLKGKHNSEPIDVGNNTLVVLRVAEHQPARQKPLDEVREQVKAELLAREGGKLAAQRGEALLAELKAGKGVDAQAWQPMQSLSRRTAGQVPSGEVRAIFAVSGKSLPGFAGLKRDTGEFVLYRVDKVLPAAALAPEESAQLSGVLSELSANSVTAAYLEQLRQKHKVVINQALTE